MYLPSTTSHIPEKLNRLQAALESLESHNVTVSQLVLSLLQEPRLQNQAADGGMFSLPFERCFEHECWALSCANALAYRIMSLMIIRTVMPEFPTSPAARLA